MLENAVWHVQPEWDHSRAVQRHIEVMSMILDAVVIASTVVFPLWNRAWTSKNGLEEAESVLLRSLYAC